MRDDLALRIAAALEKIAERMDQDRSELLDLVAHKIDAGPWGGDAGEISDMVRGMKDD